MPASSEQPSRPIPLVLGPPPAKKGAELDMPRRSALNDSLASPEDEPPRSATCRLVPRSLGAAQ
jgi:hypothetical protein